MYPGKLLEKYLGWCPHRPAEGRCPALPERADLPFSGPERFSPGAKKAGSLRELPVPEWFVSVSLVVLFATNFFGGNFWWPLLVLAILAAGMVYWYMTVVRREA
jgi:hypothetical protein